MHVPLASNKTILLSSVPWLLMSQDILFETFLCLGLLSLYTNRVQWQLWHQSLDLNTQRKVNHHHLFKSSLSSFEPSSPTLVSATQHTESQRASQRGFRVPLELQGESHKHSAKGPPYHCAMEDLIRHKPPELRRRRYKDAVTLPKLLTDSLFWNHNTCDHRNCSCFYYPPETGLDMGAANIEPEQNDLWTKNEFKKINSLANSQAETVNTSVPKVIPVHARG